VAITDINSEDRLVQETFAEHLEYRLGWDSTYAWTHETFGSEGLLGRQTEQEVVLTRDLRVALARLNPELPEVAREDALARLTDVDFSRSLVQHNHEQYRYIRDGVPVSWREQGTQKHAQARVIDFYDPANNRFLAVRELRVQGLRVPHYNRRADLVCFVNGLPIVLIELKAVYKNIRDGFENNLTDYLGEYSIAHAFHHNAFLVVSNGDRARYGSITSTWEHFAEWKRNDEREQGRLDAEMLLDGMLDKERLLDLVQHFILFDDSRVGGTRKIVARNHQVLGVNNAVASVAKQAELKRAFPVGSRVIPYVPRPRDLVEPSLRRAAEPTVESAESRLADLPLVQRAHPDLGRLGVFWHTQGSGKSYSMAYFTEKVRRTISGSFTFVIMTDREDLDDQIYRTFVGSGVADELTPRASSGEDLRRLLQGNHRYIFSLIHKFNQDIAPDEPYSQRDDIIVISDEAHRTQSGTFARNMRLALPNAAFIGFTGTPLFRSDHLTRRIFGGYVSRYDFKRSEEDGSTVKLVYENRGEKLQLDRLDLNDQIADKVEQADLDPDQTALLERLLGQDYEVITADDRLDKVARDLVEHCSARWQSGKSMLVCIDKITCARMYQRIVPYWQEVLTSVRANIAWVSEELASETDPERIEKLDAELEDLRARAQWMAETKIQIVISEAQNEVKDFNRWGFDIVPHRDLIKRGFEDDDGNTVSMEAAFKDARHPFRVAIVCAMWLTGFDVESLSTLYMDKPMKAHTLMQAIARANRVYSGKEYGLIVDYNGVLRSLREALAQYALGDDDDGTGGEEIIAPLEELVPALVAAIEESESHLRGLGFDPADLIGAHGFKRIQGLHDAVEVLYSTDEAKRRFEIMARVVFSRMRALLTEPSAQPYFERHDNIEAIFKKLTERRETADVTELLKELHRIVNEAIRAAGPGDDRAEGLTVDLSTIDFEKLRDEFASKIKRKNTVLQDIRQVVEDKLAAMVANNPLRMDYYRRYLEIIADYNREHDRTTVEDTFRRLVELIDSLDKEQERAAREGLNEEELALFDLLYRERITESEKEALKQASKSLLETVTRAIASVPHWTANEQTKAKVRTTILDSLYLVLPDPPFGADEKSDLADRVYNYVWQRGISGVGFGRQDAA
jgi:type I restriction enzyme, R subunit